ncbi:MFS transporter [Candidatus Formimonas warabiya]|uniref:MFS transporter n=1 Tax=Formimonas warabiya TaxID=1761012 RepID=A0A3G1KV42_FORW1|nr:MFS transporter [Candidatus Formimonas warabiya]ATW26306.1 MFS transporter [Candidatus Formimonas warabiya]
MDHILAGARLDRLPISKFHRKVLYLIGAGMFLDLFDVYLAGGVLGQLVKNGWSTMQLNASFISVTFVGMLIGAFVTGLVGDSFGRRFAYQIDLLIVGIASFAAALAPSMGWLILFRGIMGLGMGAEIVIGYATFSEFVPAKVRGRWISLLSLVANSSLPVCAILAYFIIPNLGWRYMFVIVGVLALIVWWLRMKYLTESPRWLEAKGKLEKAEQILSDIEHEIAQEKGHSLPVVNADHYQVLTSEKGGSIWELFSREYLKRTIVSMLYLIGTNFFTYTYVNWLPTIFIKQGISITTSLGYTFVMMLGAPFGSLIGSLITDKFGRKPISIIVFILMGICGYVYAISTTPPLLMLLGFCFMLLLYIVCAIGFGIYVPELFPTRLRIRGTGVANSAGRLAMILNPYIVVWLLNSYGVQSVFQSLAGYAFFLALVVGIFGIETKAKSLEEINRGVAV